MSKSQRPRIHLQSDSNVNARKLFMYCQKLWQNNEKDKAVNILVGCYRMEEQENKNACIGMVRGVLKGKIPFHFEGNSVVLGS